MKRRSLGGIVYFNKSPSYLVETEESAKGKVRELRGEGFLPQSREVDGILTKKALVLIEGEQTDSNQRKHVFTPERLALIAEKTNNYLNSGNRLPIIQDHRKEQNSVIGDVTGEFFLKEITEKDLYNPKLKDLIGKVGLFATEVAIRSKKAIEQARDGLLSTISAGLNLATEEIREISAVPLPAIRGCAMFSKHKKNDVRFALTLADAELEATDLAELKEELDNITDKFWNVVVSINDASVDELGDADPKELQYQAVSDYADRIIDLLGLNAPSEQEVLQQQLGEGVNQPVMNNQYGMMPKIHNYNNNKILAAFSMSDMEKISKAQNNAEFLSNPRFYFGNRQLEPEKPSIVRRGLNLAGSVAKVGAIGLGGAGALYAGRLGVAGALGKVGARGFRGSAARALQSDLGMTGRNLIKVSSKLPGRATQRFVRNRGQNLTGLSRRAGSYANKFYTATPRMT